MDPDWLGSPQHVVAGFGLTAALAVVLTRLKIVDGRWWIALVAVAATMGAEAVVELLEYPLIYSDDINATAYLDTVADIAQTLGGAVLGGAAWLAAQAAQRR